MSDGEVTSPGAATPPSSDATRAHSSASRSLISTDAPSDARRSAIARPIPPPAPVTSATRPCKPVHRFTNAATRSRVSGSACRNAVASIDSAMATARRG